MTPHRKDRSEPVSRFLAAAGLLYLPLGSLTDALMLLGFVVLNRFQRGTEGSP